MLSCFSPIVRIIGKGIPSCTTRQNFVATNQATVLQMAGAGAGGMTASELLKAGYRACSRSDFIEAGAYHLLPLGPVPTLPLKFLPWLAVFARPLLPPATQCQPATGMPCALFGGPCNCSFSTTFVVCLRVGCWYLGPGCGLGGGGGTGPVCLTGSVHTVSHWLSGGKSACAPAHPDAAAMMCRPSSIISSP